MRIFFFLCVCVCVCGREGKEKREKRACGVIFETVLFWVVKSECLFIIYIYN